MKIATWNVNSLRVRLPQVLDWLEQHQADILCLQEVQFERAKTSQGTFKYSLPEWLHQGLVEDGKYAACLPAQGSLHAMAERNKRVLRCAGHVLTEGNTLLSDEELEMIVILRMNPPQVHAIHARQLQPPHNGPLQADGC